MKIKVGDKVFLKRKRFCLFEYRYITVVIWTIDKFAMVQGVRGYIPIEKLTVINDE